MHREEIEQTIAHNAPHQFFVELQPSTADDQARTLCKNLCEMGIDIPGIWFGQPVMGPREIVMIDKLQPFNYQVSVWKRQEPVEDPVTLHDLATRKTQQMIKDLKETWTSLVEDTSEDFRKSTAVRNALAKIDGMIKQLERDL